MIDKAILKKFNLKAVPFSAIEDGQTFNTSADFPCGKLAVEFTRRLIGCRTVWADGRRGTLWQRRKENDTVYVPVWRVC